MPKVSYGAELDAQFAQWRKEQTAAYIDTGGAQGHIVDLRFVGGLRYSSMLLIRYTGRKSGRTRVVSLGYCQFGPEIGVIASMGGADVHPQWYHNIKAGGPLAFQIATQAFACSWREPAGAEREELWRWMVRSNPMFATYREATTRQIPLLLLDPGEEIPVFTRADLGRA